MRNLGRGSIIFFHSQYPNETIIKSGHLKREYLNKDWRREISDWRVSGPEAFNFKIGNASLLQCKHIFSRNRLGVGLDFSIYTFNMPDPGSVYWGSNKDSKTIGPSGKPKGNEVHKVHYAVSPEIVLMGGCNNQVFAVQY
jgi:hypothetical protein